MILRDYILLSSLILSSVCLAEKLPLPPSLSYQTMVRCIPELSDSEQMQRVQLDRVRNSLDLLFATEKKTLNSRVVDYQLSNGEQRRIKYTRGQRQNQWGYSLELFKKTEKGLELLPVSKDQAWNAPISVLNKYFEVGKILSDEETYSFVKVGGNEMLLEVNDGKVQNLNFTSASTKKSLNCRLQSGSLVVCICKSL